MRLLIVEDEQHLSIGLKFNFEAEGYEVVVAEDGPAALGHFEEDPASYSLVILDLMLPGMSGYEICRRIRQSNPYVPILALSARTLAEDKTRAFDEGVNQYMTKPFDLKELLARVRNLLQRQVNRQAIPPNPDAGPDEKSLGYYQFGNVQVDFRKHELKVKGEPQKLTTLQFKLLQLFAANEGFVLSRSQILQKVWGFDQAPMTRTVDMAVVALRKIVETDPSNPRHILSIRGAGYRFVASPEDAIHSSEST